MTTIPDRSDAKAFAKYISEVTSAFVEGKRVEYRWLPNGTDRRGGEWQPVTSHMGTHWNFTNCDYRVALEPPKEQWRPYTFETAPMTLKVRHKTNLYVGVANLLAGGFEFNSGLYNFARALDELEQLDGTPLGVKVESEPQWPKWFRNRNNEGYFWRMDGEIDGEYLGPDGLRERSQRSVSELEEYHACITAAEAAELLAGKDGAK